MTTARRFALIILLILLAGAGATPAFAGEYPVHACVPTVADVNRSWSPYVSHGGLTAYAACPAPGPAFDPWAKGLVARHIGHANDKATVPQGVFAAMNFAAPAGAAITRIAFEYNVCSKEGFKAGLTNGSGAWVFTAAPLCGSLGNRVVLPVTPTGVLRLMVLCEHGPCAVYKPLHAWAQMRSVTVTVRDSTLPSLSITRGSAVTPGWKRGTVTLGLRASDNVGIKSAQLVRGTAVLNKHDGVCDFTRAVPCQSMSATLSLITRAVPDGRQTFVLQSADAAGNARSAPVTVPIDNTAPGPPLGLRVTGASGWRRTNNFGVAWRNPEQKRVAPIAGVEYAICPGSIDSESWTGCSFANASKADVNSVTGLKVAHDGDWVARFWLRDAAGNLDRSNAQAIRLKLDAAPPQLRFDAIDPRDPTRVHLRASDSVSGVSRAEIEIRRRGDVSWLPLATQRTATGFEAVLDDELLRDGVYEMRARAFDNAGNEQSTNLEAPDRVATRTVPVRVNTTLVAGELRRVTVRRSGRGKPRTRRVIVVRPRVSYGRTIPIRGRLTTPGGNAVANAGIEVWERVAVSGAIWRQLALIGTDSHGRFRYKALRGPSRVVRFRYPGTRLVRARTTEVDIHVRASTTLRTSRRRVVNGEDVVLRGRILGGPLPTSGKLIQLQAFSRGRWLTFATPRANAKTGRWSYRYRFTATRGTVRYRFRARLPREAGFPYDSGTSRFAYVTVRGL